MHPLLDPIFRHAQERPEQPAACDQSLALDYRALAAVAAGLANHLSDATTRSHVGLLLPTSSANAAALLAAWAAGKTPVPLNFLLAPEELKRIAGDAELDLVLTVKHFLPLAQQLTPNVIELNATTLVPGRIEPAAAEPDDTAVILYTSGTSGAPRGVCLTFDNLLHNARASIEYARITPEQAFLGVLPQFHCFGLTAMTICPLVLGATVYYLPRFSPLAIVETIRQRQISVFMAIPSMYAAMLSLKDVEPDAFSSIALAISGGEPLPTRVARGFEERFGVSLLEGYGLTETSPVVSLNTPRAYRPGSVGKPLPGLTVTVTDDVGNPLPSNQVGELVIRGHCVMRGYWKRDNETQAAIRDGAFRTGDMGYIDDDGFVFITGRAKEMLIVAGENVFPAEIENTLLLHPAVAEAAVVGASDPSRGEVPVAFVTLRAHEETPTESDLRAFCRGSLAGYKSPKKIYIIDDLPHGPTGKILKRSLLERLPDLAE